MQAPSSLQAVWPVRAEWLTVVTRHQDDHTRSIAFLGDQDGSVKCGRPHPAAALATAGQGVIAIMPNVGETHDTSQ